MEVSYYNLSGGINTALTKQNWDWTQNGFIGVTAKTLRFCKTEEL